MAVFSEEFLSGSPGNGRRILVVQTATAGDVIHTATAVAGVMDEIYLTAYNSHTSSVELTIEFGGVTDPDDHIVKTIAVDDGLIQIVAGEPLGGGVVVRAFAAVANVITLGGFVQRIEP